MAWCEDPGMAPRTAALRKGQQREPYDAVKTNRRPKCIAALTLPVHCVRPRHICVRRATG